MPYFKQKDRVLYSYATFSLRVYSLLNSLSYGGGDGRGGGRPATPPFEFFLVPFLHFYLDCNFNYNKRLSQQPALGALTFLRSFVAGKTNLCSHLLASLVHFTVVKLQAILIIRIGVAKVIYHSSWGRRSYFRRNFVSSASFKTTKFLPRWICSGTTILRVDSAYRSSL